MVKDKKKTKKEKRLEERIATPGIVTFTIKCGKLKELVKIVHVIVDEAVLEFSTEGVTVKTVDEKMTYAGEVSITMDGFTNYECRKEGVKLGFKVNKLMEFVVGVKPSDLIECEFNDETLKATFRAGNLSREIKLFDDFTTWTTWRKSNVNITHPHTFEGVDNLDITNALKGAEDVNGSEVLFESTKKGFRVRSEDDNKTDEIDIPFGFDGKDKKVMTSKFPIDQVRNAVKVSNGKVQMAMGDNLPLTISWVPDEGMTAYFLISPLVGGD